MTAQERYALLSALRGCIAHLERISPLAGLDDEDWTQLNRIAAGVATMVDRHGPAALAEAEAMRAAASLRRRQLN